MIFLDHTPLAARLGGGKWGESVDFELGELKHLQGVNIGVLLK